MESKTIETIKCSQCKVNLPMTNEHFKVKKGGDFTKQCIKCLEIQKKSRIKNKCEHNRQRSLCIDCGGSQICKHNRRRNNCKECNNPIQLTIRNMIKCSKQSDKKTNRYDPVNFIDYCFVENLIDDCDDRCFYCNCELQYVNYTGNLATIERLNNEIGHIKGNCVIACRNCNLSKVGNTE